MCLCLYVVDKKRFRAFYVTFKIFYCLSKLFSHLHIHYSHILCECDSCFLKQTPAPYINIFVLLSIALLCLCALSVCVQCIQQKDILLLLASRIGDRLNCGKHLLNKPKKKTLYHRYISSFLLTIVTFSNHFNGLAFTGSTGIVLLGSFPSLIYFLLQ